jgi:hypothetical protein
MRRHGPCGRRGRSYREFRHCQYVDGFDREELAFVRALAARGRPSRPIGTLKLHSESATVSWQGPERPPRRQNSDSGPPRPACGPPAFKLVATWRFGCS